MAVLETATEIRPFDVDFPEEELAEMRRRISGGRWPTKELVDDRSQGVRLATLQELARYCSSLPHSPPPFTKRLGHAS